MNKFSNIICNYENSVLKLLEYIWKKW